MLKKSHIDLSCFYHSQSKTFATIFANAANGIFGARISKSRLNVTGIAVDCLELLLE